jgi:hypothetical protein
MTTLSPTVVNLYSDKSFVSDQATGFESVDELEIKGIHFAALTGEEIVK